MNKLAVDIVLIPDKSVSESAISLNRSLESAEQKIILDNDTCLPHVSLAMGVLNMGNIERIAEGLKEMIRQLNVPELHITAVETVEATEAETISTLLLEKTALLYEYHVQAMQLAEAYFTSDASMENFYPDPPPEEITLFWLNRYAVNSAYSKFNPHITLGTGILKMTREIAPGRSQPVSLALFQLGNYCTCRKKLLDYPFS